MTPSNAAAESAFWFHIIASGALASIAFSLVWIANLLSKIAARSADHGDPR